MSEPSDCNGEMIEYHWLRQWPGGLGSAYLFPALSFAGASIALPCSVSTSPPHQTGRADFPHPAFGQELMGSHTEDVDVASGVGRGPTRCAGIHQGIVHSPDPAACTCDTTTDEPAYGHG